MKMDIIMGLDVGNGYLKGRYLGEDGKPHTIDAPSCASGMVNKLSIPDLFDENWIQSVFDNMILQIDSPLVEDNRYLLFGKRALHGPTPSIMEFDIASGESKAEQELSSILVLSSVTGAVLRNHYSVTKEIPCGIIDVRVFAGLALPIDEYASHHVHFRQKFLDGVHVVTLANFDQPVTLRIHFEDIDVTAEGVSAQKAIASRGVGLATGLLGDVRKHDPDALPGISAKDIVSCANTCGIDIGEGTVNIPVMLNGVFDQINSRTIPMGFGTVLESTLHSLRHGRTRLQYGSRKELADLLQSDVTVFNENRIRFAREQVLLQAGDLVSTIIQQLSPLLSKGNVSIIYVYGGGATLLKDALYAALANKVELVNGGDVLPILYLDSRFSRNLNREGLYDTATTLYKKRKK